MFDLDGVLIQPGGYRQAVLASLRHFCIQMGIPDTPLPHEDHFALLESLGITSEWDMLPILAAAILDASASITPLPPRPFSNLSGLISTPVDVDYPFTISRMAQFLSKTCSPADALWAVLQDGQAKSLLPSLGKHPVLKDLFSQTRSISDSWFTRTFQNYVLGSEEFSLVYGFPAPIQTISLLMSLDQPLLSVPWAHEIKSQMASQTLIATAMTARPSKPPVEISSPPAGCTPEAELALQVVGLKNMPCVGYGSLVAYAQCQGLDAEQLLKPNPFHALTAILHSVGVPHWDSLNLADQFIQSQTGLPDRLSENSWNIKVFEDSPIGIQAVRSAVQRLIQAGVNIQFSAIGISPHPEKQNALRMQGARLYPNINSALSAEMTIPGN